MNKIKRLVISSYCAIVLISCGKESINEPKDELSQLVVAEMEKWQIPSLAAAIIKDGETVWSFVHKTHGGGEPLTEETIFPLASVSKTITGVAVMQLYERGLLNLDADVQTYLPYEVRNPHHPEDMVTARMLLTHTSGLAWPTQEEDPGFSTRFPDGSEPPLGDWIRQYIDPMEANYLNSTWKPSRPGEEFLYSNIGIALLGHLVEVVSGQPFAAYCRQQIFSPLQMSDSGFSLEDVNKNKLTDLFHNNNPIGQYTFPFYPAALARSSLKDLSHYCKAILNGGIYDGNRILEGHTVNEMLSIQQPDMGLYGAGMALAWQAMDQDWIGHLGASWGISTSLDLEPDEGLAVIILANANDMDPVYPGGYIYERLHFEATIWNQTMGN